MTRAKRLGEADDMGKRICGPVGRDWPVRNHPCRPYDTWTGQDKDGKGNRRMEGTGRVSGPVLMILMTIHCFLLSESKKR